VIKKNINPSRQPVEEFHPEYFRGIKDLTKRRKAIDQKVFALKKRNLLTKEIESVILELRNEMKDEKKKMNQ
jgi:hypothetical protein